MCRVVTGDCSAPARWSDPDSKAEVGAVCTSFVRRMLVDCAADIRASTILGTRRAGLHARSGGGGMAECADRGGFFVKWQGPSPTNARKYIEDRIAIVGECWEWQNYLRKDGYGAVGNKLAHRISYEALVGPIPDGLTIDHLCRNRRCVNPAHLEPVTMAINILRGISPAANHARKTHCIYGHELAGDNLYVDPKRRRICRVCSRIRDSNRYYRDVAKAKAVKTL